MVQGLNWQALLYTPYVMFLDQSLAIPHFSVKDISAINPEKLKERGFQGMVFDKDNTLTTPYVNEIYPGVKEAFANIKKVFGKRL